VRGCWVCHDPGMEELSQSDVPAFIKRWGDFHDAVVQRVQFDLERSSVIIDLHAQDGRQQWEWRAVRLVLEDLVEWSFPKPENMDVRVIFEAGVRWDNARALISLDTKSSSSPEEFRAGLYFGGGRILCEIAPLPL
jgi:hypothetical protein